MIIHSLLFGRTKNKETTQFLENRAPIRSIPFHLRYVVHRKIRPGHIYLEAGGGKPVIFCHGLFGGIFNIDTVCAEIAKEYRFIMPYLPMYDPPLKDCTVKYLGHYLGSLINELELEEAVVIGNSMGGGAALHYALQSSNKLKGLVLCGSSGLSNIPLSKGYFKRKDVEFVKEAVRDIFIDRSIPPGDMMTDVFNALQSNEQVIRAIRLTKSATKHTLEKELPGIHTPTLLVWGKQDPITPASIAPIFQQLMPNAELHLIDDCGHVPQQEKPYQFLEQFFNFMKKINY
jgi:2-hydroxy-6-oxonona-2,4-dienedioate hydrolase